MTSRLTLALVFMICVSCEFNENKEGNFSASLNQESIFENSRSGFFSESSEKSLEAFTLRDRPAMKDLVTGTTVVLENTKQTLVSIQTSTGDFDYRCLSVLESSNSGSVIKPSVRCSMLN